MHCNIDVFLIFPLLTKTVIVAANGLVHQYIYCLLYIQSSVTVIHYTFTINIAVITVYL